MESFTPLTSRATGFERAKTAPSYTIPVSTFGRLGERHVTGTITRREIDRTRWLTEAPRRYLVAFALLITPTFWRELTEGSNPQSVAVIAAALGFFVWALLGIGRFLDDRRIRRTEEFADATHIASGQLLGSGPLRAGSLTSRIGIYATNHGVIAITEKRDQRREFQVHRLDLTATREGQVTSSAFMVEGEQYALRAVRGQIRPGDNEPLVS